MRNPNFANSIALRALFAVTTLVAVGIVRAQNINVTAANASNDAIYSVAFSNGSGTISILNTDGGSLHDVTSLAFFPNRKSFQLDLLVTDNQGGLILRYPGDFHPGTPTTGTVVFAAGNTGPDNPDGLSVDAAGNLFVVNDKEGSTSIPQLWVLPSDGAGGFANPVLLDAAYGSNENLQETLIVGTTIIPPGGASPVLYPGDLLVLTNNPSTVLRYAGSNGNGPISATTPTTPPLITLPAGTIPGGMAFWPPDNSLLITTSRGTILQYHLTPNETPGTFASGLGNGKFKIKTGIQFGLPYAYVANNNGGTILQFGGPNQLLATVTAGVQHPQGLATTNVAYAPLTSCQDQQTNGCDLLGGGQSPVITHDVTNLPPLGGNVVEDVCVVPVDPRIAQYLSCTDAAASAQYQNGLPVAQVCAGYGSTVIPNSLCGASGSNSSGFALVKTLTQAYATPASFPFNGALISNDSNLPNVLPPSPTNPNPVCNPPGTPLGTLAWAPLAGEGIVAEGNNMLDVTSGCDGSTSKSYGLSLFGIGLGLNNTSAVTEGIVDFIVDFTKDKYTKLLNTIAGTPLIPTSQVGEGVLPQPIAPSSLLGSPKSLPGNFTYQLQQCIDTSQAVFLKGAPPYYPGAAAQLLAADQQVAAVATLIPPSGPFAPDSDYPNPSGALRSRLQNMYYTINTRIDGKQAASPPPPLQPPTISGTPVLKVSAGKMYSFQPTAADFAGDTAPQSYLTFSIVAKPSWATFSTTTGLLTGIAVKGTYSGIVISVTDGCASASLPAFSIRVN